MSTRRNRRGNRRNSRRNRRNTRRNYRGGEYSNPAPVGVDQMGDMTRQSLNQGQQYASFHVGQHGGASLVGGPYPGTVGGEALLSDNLAASARVGPLNAALNEIRGMQDGGRRRRRNRRNRKTNRKDRRNRRSRNRRTHGGGLVLNPALVSAPGQILPSSVTAAGMNPEWRLAENPRAFAP